MQAFTHPSLADVAQLVEHVLGKDEVTGSIPVIGSKITRVAIPPPAVWCGISATRR